MLYRPVEISPEHVQNWTAEGRKLGLWQQQYSNDVPTLIAWKPSDEKPNTIMNVLQWSHSMGRWGLYSGYNTRIEKKAVLRFDMGAYNAMVRHAQEIYDRERAILAMAESLLPEFPGDHPV